VSFCAEHRVNEVPGEQPRKAALFVLRAYKWAISPMFLPACRYRPTCSEYAMEAIDRFGVMRGGVMAVWRLLRCHPFVNGGYDPVLKPADRGQAAESGSHKQLS